MATLRRGLVDRVKKVATKAGTRGARALVETTVAAVKTVDMLQEKLGHRASKPRSVKVPVTRAESVQAPAPKAPTKVSRTTARAATRGVAPTRGLKDVVAKKAPAVKSMGVAATKRRRSTIEAEALPVELREAGRKTMPGAAPKRSKAAQAPGFKVKRGQKHRHTGR